VCPGEPTLPRPALWLPAAPPDQTLLEMANEMAVEQASEIRRMEQLGV
jgi:hypothetical protein